ncbi:unannotated protein [freshwater metagenome]|uniref:Unannotated protein n=1 Tax=freshwater metagenome TaxID=449393 RepID=A0A6J7ITV3_9ZZZZ
MPPNPVQPWINRAAIEGYVGTRIYDAGVSHYGPAAAGRKSVGLRWSGQKPGERVGIVSVEAAASRDCLGGVGLRRNGNNHEQAAGQSSTEDKPKGEPKRIHGCKYPPRTADATDSERRTSAATNSSAHRANFDCSRHSRTPASAARSSRAAC